MRLVKKSKRFIARVMLPFLMVFFIMAPVRESYAQSVPVAIAFAIVGGDILSVAARTFMSTGVIAANEAVFDLAASAFTLIRVGKLLSFVAVQDSNGGRILLPTTSDIALPRPDAALTDGVVLQYKCNGPSGLTNTDITPSDACLAVAQRLVVNAQICSCNGVSCVYQSGAGSCLSSNSTLSFTTLPGCNTGYWLSQTGTACTLFDPNLVVSDNAIEYSRSGSQLSPMEDVDDTNYEDNLVIHGLGLNDHFEMGGVSLNGQIPLGVQVIPNTSGGSQILIATQSLDAQGQPLVIVETITVDATGHVSKVFQTQSSGAVAVSVVDQTVVIPTGVVVPVSGTGIGASAADIGGAVAAALKVDEVPVATDSSSLDDASNRFQ